jgi:uncharacterized protein (TIGR03435 family)
MTESQRSKNSERVRERLRTLLAERFGLVVHQESKDVAVLLLTVAKGGPKMKAASEDAANQGMRGTGRGHTQGNAVTMERMAAYLGTVTGRRVDRRLSGLELQTQLFLKRSEDARAVRRRCCAIVGRR